MKPRRDPHKEFEKNYGQSQMAYVLITCGNPSKDGEMQVQMTYGGSSSLAHYLINGAQIYLEEEPLDAPDCPALQLVKS